MQAGRATAQQFLALLRAVFDAELRRCCVVRSDGIQFGAERGRDFCAAHHREFFDLSRAHDGDYSRNDGHVDAVLGEVIAELEIVCVVEKHLRDDEVGALVDLLFEA